MDWKAIFQCFIEGKQKADGKTQPVGSITKGTVNRLTFEQALEKNIFGGILQQDIIDISFDDAAMSEAFMRMREANNWQCIVLPNPQNGHIHTYWRNTARRVEKDGYTDATTACGMTVDIHGGFTYNRLREPAHDRFPPAFAPEQDIDEVPDELLPVKTSKTLWGLSEGSGRNAEMYSYINVLISQLGLSPDQCRHVLRNTNSFVFAGALPDSELKTILRDESFEKPFLAAKSSADSQEYFKQFLKSLGMSIKYNELLNIVEYGDIPKIEDYPRIKDIQNVMPIKLAFDFSEFTKKRISKQKVMDLILLEADTHIIRYGNSFNLQCGMGWIGFPICLKFWILQIRFSSL